MSLRGIRSSPDRCMAGYVMCDFTQSLLHIFGGGVSDLSVSVLDHALQRQQHLFPHGRDKRNHGLQCSAYQIDYYRIQRSVSFFDVRLSIKSSTATK